MSIRFVSHLLLLIAATLVAIDLQAVEIPAEVLAAEQYRIEIVEKVSRSTIAIFEPTGNSGGSGVIIDSTGFAITNFHVTAPCGPLMTVGTSDGEVHQAVIVSIDPSGDIALIKLLGTEPYTPALIGDSDLCRVGDEVIVAGNPFLLADSFSPTITHGILSGVHRYQPPSGTLLEYTDCLQTDASINPGNSGGPLFNMRGELIGINGRGSFEKRGRVNVGVGYAVSVNQVMRFLPFLKSGRVVDHAALGATVRTDYGLASGESRAVVNAIRSDSDAYRRGLRPGDELLLFGDNEIRSANELLNLIGTHPPGWRVPIVYRRNSELLENSIRLENRHTASALREGMASMMPKPAEKPKPSEKVVKEDSAEPPAWKALYEPADGYANRYFNRIETARVLERFRIEATNWTAFQLQARGDLKNVATAHVDETEVRWESPAGRFRLDTKRPFDLQPVPSKMPGLLAGLWIREAFRLDQTGRLDDCFYVGQLPWHVGQEPVDVLRVWHRGAVADYYFALADNKLLGFEVTLDDEADPVRVEFRANNEWHVEVGDQLRGDFVFRKIPSVENKTNRPSAGGTL